MSGTSQLATFDSQSVLIPNSQADWVPTFLGVVLPIYHRQQRQKHQLCNDSDVFGWPPGPTGLPGSVTS